jgi:uncharacterized protein YyaL (SSP411 family)
MAAMINAAHKTYNDQKAAEAAAKKQAEIQKKEELQEILDLFADWFNTYYGVDAKGELEADAVLELIESVQEYIKAMTDLNTALGVKMPAAPIGTKVIKSNTAPKTADDKINDFLTKMGW